MSRENSFGPDRAKFGQPRSPADINIGPINQMPIDRFGNVIRQHSAVLFKPEVDMVFQVVDVKPVLDPRAPVGQVDVVLAAPPFTLRFPARQPLGRFIVVAQSATPPDAEVAQLDTPAPEGDPPAEP